jgi:hypothetical protein
MSFAFWRPCILKFWLLIFLDPDIKHLISNDEFSLQMGQELHDQDSSARVEAPYASEGTSASVKILKKIS